MAVKNFVDRVIAQNRVVMFGTTSGRTPHARRSCFSKITVLYLLKRYISMHSKKAQTLGVPDNHHRADVETKHLRAPSLYGL
ncbi:unnamed protein product [Peniophora sp. CBMAI 1063]|nr:unnamed protein product [Peniophora sp. CBMAI 1063]